MLAAGQRIPDCVFSIMTVNGPSDAGTYDVFAGRSVILFGVPGAFTPSCHDIHLPSYIAEFAIAAGLALDARRFGLGIRSRRYALWARDGIVQLLNVEEDPTVAEVSTAYSMLKMFNEWNEAGPGL